MNVTDKRSWNHLWIFRHNTMRTFDMYELTPNRPGKQPVCHWSAPVGYVHVLSSCSSERPHLKSARLHYLHLITDSVDTVNDPELPKISGRSPPTPPLCQYLFSVMNPHSSSSIPYNYHWSEFRPVDLGGTSAVISHIPHVWAYGNSLFRKSGKWWEFPQQVIMVCQVTLAPLQHFVERLYF